MASPQHPDPRVQYAREKEQGMSHRHPLIALIYGVVADVLSHAETEQESDAA